MPFPGMRHNRREIVEVRNPRLAWRCSPRERLLFVVGLLFFSDLILGEGNRWLFPMRTAYAESTYIEDPVEIPLRVTVQPRRSDTAIFPDCRVDLGELECGKKYLLKIRVINESQEPLEFRRVGASCSCVDLRVRKGELPVGESAEVEAQLTVPKQMDAEAFLMGLEFFADKQGRDEIPFLRVIAQSRKIRGVFNFGSVPSAFQVGQSLKRLTLPLIVTEPIDPKSLIIEASDSLQDAVLSIESSGDQEEVRMDISGVVLEDGFRDCWVKVIHKESGQSAEARFLLERSQPATVSPKIATLIRDSERGCWNAKLFLVIDQALLSQSPVPSGSPAEPTTKMEAEVTAKLGEKTLATKSTAVRPGLWRVELEIPDSDLPDKKEGEILWSVQAGEFQATFHSRWRIF